MDRRPAGRSELVPRSSRCTRSARGGSVDLEEGPAEGVAVRGGAVELKPHRRTLVGGVVALGALALFCAQTRALSIDEFQYAHAAWLVAHGKVPYRDFFEVHLPLVYLLYAPIFWITQHAAPALRAMRAGMSLWVLGGAAAAADLAEDEGAVAGWLSALVLLANFDWVRFAFEVRPDALGCVLFAAALTMSRRGRPLASGVLWALCLAATQKAFMYAAPLGVLALVDGTRGRGREGAIRFATGAAVVTAIAGTALTLTHAWGAWWQWCVHWAAEHERGYPGFSFTTYLWPAALRSAVPIVLAGWAWVRANPRGANSTVADRALWFAWPLSFASFALQRAAFPYSLLPFLWVTSVYAGRALGWLFVRAWLMGASALLVSLVGVGWLVLDRPPIGPQLAELTKLETLTAPDDVAYDNSGSCVTRPSPDFFFYTDAFIRSVDQRRLSEELPQELAEKGTVAWLEDARTDGLPEQLRAFLRTHYQPYDGDLRLLGQRFEPSSDGELWIFKSGRYFLEPSAAATAVRLDDGPVEGEFVVPSGKHRLHVGWTAGPVYILWLPANGARWMPRPEATPLFSRVL